MDLRYATVCRGLVSVVLFFVLLGIVRANDESLRKSLDQLSASYADVQQRLRDREAALQALTAGLAISRTESDLFQKLWVEAKIRAQALGTNLAEPDTVTTHRQLVEALRKLYATEADCQRLIELLKRVVEGIDSKRDITGEIEALRQLLADKTVSYVARPVCNSTLSVAQVLEVNPKLRLVVLDIGAQTGARIGMPLTILRGDRGVAELRIVEVRQKICGALIENVEDNVTLQVGDTAQVTKG